MLSIKIYNIGLIGELTKEAITNHGYEADKYLPPQALGQINRKCNKNIDTIKTYYIQGEPDTFKVASCVMLAIYETLYIADDIDRAQIALDVAYRLIEKPYWNKGQNFDIPFALEEIDFASCFEGYEEIFKESNENLVASLVLENSVPLNYFMNFQLLYDLGVAFKHKQDKINTMNEPIEKEKEEPVKKLKKPSFLDLIKKKKED